MENNLSGGQATAKFQVRKYHWTVLGSGDGNRKEWKAHRNISEIALLVLDDLLETLRITVLSGIYCVINSNNSNSKYLHSANPVLGHVLNVLHSLIDFILITL